MRNNYRVLLVDDEDAGRKALRELLEAHHGVEIVGEADSAKAAIPLFQRHSPDLVFLDIQMPREDGFSLLPKLQPPPAVIFVTAHDQFAVRAFEVNAVDYLMKPVRADRLASALKRAFSQRFDQAKPFLQDDRILLRSDSEQRFVPANEIACIEADGNYSRVHITKRPSIFMRRGMAEWESLLPQPPFLRVHRSLIVNLMAVETMTPEQQERVRIGFNGCSASMTVARRAYRRLRHALGTLKGS